MRLRLVMIVALLVCSMLIGLLAYQNRSLRSLTQRLAREAVYPQPGLAVPPLAVSTVAEIP